VAIPEKMLDWDFMASVIEGEKNIPRGFGPEKYDKIPKYPEFSTTILYKFVILQDPELFRFFPRKGAPAWNDETLRRIIRTFH